MFEVIVQKALEEALEQRDDLFLVTYNIAPDNTIDVTIDGDQGVTVEDCVYISRAVEGVLNRDEVDFSLQVSSAGATTPLQQPRQYVKHIGRTLSIKTKEKAFQGELIKTDDNTITVTWSAREPKAVGKGKTTVTKQKNITYSDIIEAKVKITF